MNEDITIEDMRARNREWVHENMRAFRATRRLFMVKHDNAVAYGIIAPIRPVNRPVPGWNEGK